MIHNAFGIEFPDEITPFIKMSFYLVKRHPNALFSWFFRLLWMQPKVKKSQLAGYVSWEAEIKLAVYVHYSEFPIT